MTDHAPSAKPDDHHHGDDEPDPKVLWRWAGQAARPWVGWGFVGIGALLVLLGYFGVSRESIVEKQVPYLVSGGIGGVLLCVIGAYFLGTEELRKDSGRLDRLEQMVDELHAALLVRPDSPPRPTAGANGSEPEVVTLVAVQGGETYHRLGCPMAEGKAVDELDDGDVDRRGLRPCPLCEPLGAPASVGS